MRTTVSINDKLLERAKKAAGAKGQTLGQYLEDAIRRELLAPVEVERPPVKLPVFHGGGGFRPGIDPTSNRSLYDALDASGDLK